MFVLGRPKNMHANVQKWVQDPPPPNPQLPAKNGKLSASRGIIGVVAVVVECERVPSVTLNVPERYTERSRALNMKESRALY